jgi:hypothetical protein
MSSQAGPFDLWSSGLGFEYFYGFIGGDSDQWHPALYENTMPVHSGVGRPLDRGGTERQRRGVHAEHGQPERFRATNTTSPGR